MPMMEEKDARFTALERKVGIFVFVAMLCTISAVIFIGVKKDMFKSKSVIYFVADSGADLNVGQAVKFKGFRIGKVETVELNDLGKVEVALSIQRSYMKFIKADSEATLTQEGMLGDYVIEISQGSPRQNAVDVGDMIMFRRAISLSDVAEELRGQLESVIVEIQKITGYITNPQGDVKRAMANVNQLTGELLVTKKHVDDLIMDTRQQVVATLRNVDDTVDSVDNTISMVGTDVVPGISLMLETANSTILNADKTVSNVDGQIKHLAGKVDSSLDNVLIITEDVKRASFKMPGLLADGDIIIEDTQSIMDSVKKTWPISRNIEHPEDRPLAVDSYE